MHSAPGQEEVFGDLRPRLPVAHHQDVAVGQCRRGAVSRGVDLLDRRRQAFGEPRDDRDVVAAGSDDDLSGVQRPGGGLDVEAAVGALSNRGDRDVFTDRRRKRIRVSAHKCVSLLAGHKSVRVPACVPVTGKVALPIRCHQSETVPTPLTPLVTDRIAFEDHVVDSALNEAPADRQSGLSTADDHDVVMFSHCVPPGTVAGLMSSTRIRDSGERPIAASSSSLNVAAADVQ